MIDTDKNFELLPTIDATDGAVFGIHQHVSLDDDGFAPGSTDWAVQDSENPQNGTTGFGRDRLLGPTWSWQLHVNRDNETEALETLRSFRSAWHWLHGRNTPGMVTALRYQLNGERRRIYGRPRRFEAPPDNLIMSGYVPISVDFKCADGFVYDDDMQEVVMQLGMEYEDPDADSGGGFIMPVTFPVVTLPPTLQQTHLQVGGDAPAYPIIRFTGPVVRPTLTTPNWSVTVDATVPEGYWVEIDTRPWVTTALMKPNNFPLGGLLGRRTRMSKMFFEPGRFEARYTGVSSGVSTCSIQWAPTWNSY